MRNLPEKLPADYVPIEWIQGCPVSVFTLNLNDFSLQYSRLKFQFFHKIQHKITFAKVIGKSYENIFKIFSKWFYLILLEPKDRLRRTN